MRPEQAAQLEGKPRQSALCGRDGVKILAPEGQATGAGRWRLLPWEVAEDLGAADDAGRGLRVRLGMVRLRGGFRPLNQTPTVNV